MTPAELPNGKTCADCAHIDSCVALGQSSRSATKCYVAPPLFLSAERGSSLITRKLRAVDEWIENAKASGLVREVDGMLSLTPSGEAMAAQVAEQNPRLDKIARAAIDATRHEPYVSPLDPPPGDPRAAHKVIPGTRECAPECECWAHRRKLRVVTP